MSIQNSFEKTKYILVSLILYTYVFGVLWFFVEALGLDEFISYIITYLSAYLFDYLLTLKWVFKGEHKNKKLYKYLLYLFFCLLINFILYRFVFEYFNYMISALFVAVALFPLRFFISKAFVYTN